MTLKGNSLEQVREFQKAFKAPVIEGVPASLDANVIPEDRLHLRLELIAEEFIELVEAVYGKESSDTVSVAWENAKTLDSKNRDVVETADALGDLVYVINGFAVETGIPLDKVIDEIHSSNMSKLGEDGNPILREDGKILKGKNYFRPDLRKVLDTEIV